MKLDTIFTWLNRLWKIADQIPEKIKTLLIVIGAVVALTCIIPGQLRQAIINEKELADKNERNADKYTIESSHIINDCILNIEREIPECYNVLLLNYHNSTTSLQGFRYLYLNCITEHPRGIEDELLKDYWNDLEYIYYEDELSRIHNTGYFKVNDIEKIHHIFPKLYKRLQISGAKAVGFCPVEGIESPIGIVLILYKDVQEGDVQYNSTISNQIQKLSTILDYETIKKL